MPHRTYSSLRATTPPRWTRSRNGPGVSKPVLYQHFPGKLELYLALLDESAEELVQTVSEALSSTTDNRQRVPATFKAFYDFVASGGRGVPAGLRVRP